VSHWYKTENSAGWHIAMNVKIRFKLQVTASPGFHSLYDWCYQAMWLFSGAPISNNPGFRLKHPGVPDCSDGSDGTSYPLTENYTLPVAQATGRVA